MKEQQGYSFYLVIGFSHLQTFSNPTVVKRRGQNSTTLISSIILHIHPLLSSFYFQKFISSISLIYKCILEYPRIKNYTSTRNFSILLHFDLSGFSFRNLIMSPSIIHTYRRTIILFFFFLKIKVESEIEFRELKFVGTFLTTWKFRKYNDTRLGGYKYRPNISRASSLPPLRSDCVFLKSRLRNASECKYLIKDYVSFGKCVEVVVYLRSKNTALRCIVIY